MESLHFLYHELRQAPSRYSYVMTGEEFEEHCRFFAEWQRSVSPQNLCPEVTFDDGHLSDATLALPILQRYSLRARFFITAGWTGKKAGYMGWPELRMLHAAGHHVGAHGLQHRLLTSCSEAELRQELEESRTLLEEGLGAKVRTMSLPGGRSNNRVLRACRAAGYEQVFTSTPTAADMMSFPATVGRLNLLHGTTTSWLQRVLEPETGQLAKLERTDRVKAGAKRLLGDRLYAQLWALGNRQESKEEQAEVSAP